MRRLKRPVAPLVLCVVLGSGGACSAGPARRAEPVPKHVLEAKNGFFVLGKNETTPKFIEWESEATATRAIRSLRKSKGGTLYFAPGRYVVRHGIFIYHGENIQLIAAPGVELVFPPAPRGPRPRLARPAMEGQRHLTLDRPNALSVGGRYQIYSASRKGDRLLEFVVREVDGTRVTINRPIQFMQHVKAIPEHAVVLEELNFFRLYNSPDVTVRGFTLDGLDRGLVLGHTTYSGLIASNSHYQARKAGGPQFSGLRLIGNTFRNLKGRGAAIYATDDVLVEGNRFSNIGREAIEIDHFSSGRVTRNHISRAGVGIRLNDAFDTAVDYNTIEDTARAVVFFSHFDDSWVNAGNLIVGNTIIGPGAVGVSIDSRARRNIVFINRFRRIRQKIVGDAGRNWIGKNGIR